MAKGKKFVELGIAVALFAGCAGTVIAADAATSIAARKAAMKQVATASIKLRNPATTPADMAAAGQTIADQTKIFAANFPKGSEPSAATPSKALPAVWSDAKGFKVETDKAIKAATALSNTKDAAAAQAAAKVVLGNCTECHDKYREKAS
jgi:cytochrome c556